jgi:hypothetical protein
VPSSRRRSVSSSVTFRSFTFYKIKPVIDFKKLSVIKLQILNTNLTMSLLNTHANQRLEFVCTVVVLNRNIVPVLVWLGWSTGADSCGGGLCQRIVRNAAHRGIVRLERGQPRQAVEGSTRYCSHRWPRTAATGGAQRIPHFSRTGADATDKPGESFWCTTVPLKTTMNFLRRLAGQRLSQSQTGLTRKSLRLDDSPTTATLFEAVKTARSQLHGPCRRIL